MRSKFASKTCWGDEYMLYRKLGSTKEEVSILGFGCMRLPVLDDKPDKIDTKLATSMLHYAIDNGVNYIDTAYPYHGNSLSEGGMSEVFLGEALKGGYREKVNLATKLPSWLIEDEKDFEFYLNQQLDRLQTDQIDFYLLHTLNRTYWPKLENLGVTNFLDAAIADGKIKYTGFSFHDDFEVLPEIISAYNWDVCQLQYNYMDKNYQAGIDGLRYASDQGLGVVVMEPLKGGVLANNVPPEVQSIWDMAEIRRTPAEWAFKYLWDDPQIDVVLSGMSSMEQVVENIKIADEGHPNSLTFDEKDLIREAKYEYGQRIKVGCTSCGYCMPCPSGVDIPHVLKQLNHVYMFDDPSGAKSHYYGILKESERAINCTECGECEKQCPQGVSIIKILKEVVEKFGS